MWPEKLDLISMCKVKQRRLGYYAFMSGEHNERELGMPAALVLCDDDRDSFWVVGIDAKGAVEAMVQYGVGSIEQSG